MQGDSETYGDIMNVAQTPFVIGRHLGSLFVLVVVLMTLSRARSLWKWPHVSELVSFELWYNFAVCRPTRDTPVFSTLPKVRPAGENLV